MQPRACGGVCDLDWCTALWLLHCGVVGPQELPLALGTCAACVSAGAGALPCVGCVDTSLVAAGHGWLSPGDPAGNPAGCSQPDIQPHHLRATDVPYKQETSQP